MQSGAVHVSVLRWPVQLFLYLTLNLWLSHCTRGGGGQQEKNTLSDHYSTIYFPAYIALDTGLYTAKCMHAESRSHY